MKNSIEEDMKILEGIIKGDEDCINAIYSQMKVKNDNDEDIQYYKKEIQSIKNIVNNYLKEKARADKLEKEYSIMLSQLDEREIDYKRVLKENEIYKKNSEIMSKENLSTAEQLKVEIKENFRLKNQLENNRKEYQETYKDVREELKELKKENEELLQEKINNQKIIVLAQNDMLNYQAGFEDGKNGRTSAVQSIIENQQYYIFQKQIEKYERHIEKLQKENEELKDRIREHTMLISSYYVKENNIPVQKVKDKIEEILNNGEYRIIFEGDAEFPDEATCIDAQKYIKLEKLQELLEGRK